jgi:hypothetical protein
VIRRLGEKRVHRWTKGPRQHGLNGFGGRNKLNGVFNSIGSQRYPGIDL